MIPISSFINSFETVIRQGQRQPWEITNGIAAILIDLISQLNDDYEIKDDIGIHNSAVVESNVVLKPPVIIGKNCFIGANAYLRHGVFLTEHVRIGTGCEIKSTIVFKNSSIAHFNFLGDSIIGSEVNFEAGAITANHYNERQDKRIFVRHNSALIDTGINKFGSLIGDGSKIGANAVLSPGTILPKDTIVRRLELVDQTNK